MNKVQAPIIEKTHPIINYHLHRGHHEHVSSLMPYFLRASGQIVSIHEFNKRCSPSQNHVRESGWSRGLHSRGESLVNFLPGRWCEFPVDLLGCHFLEFSGFFNQLSGCFVNFLFFRGFWLFGCGPEEVPEKRKRGWAPGRFSF